MVAERTETPELVDDAEQLALFQDQIGVEAMPEGISRLDSRELRLVVQFLSHGRSGQAAIDAGYAKNVKVGAVKAHEVLNRPHVQRVLRHLLRSLTEDGGRIVERKIQLSLNLHSRAMKASERVETIEWMLEKAEKKIDDGLFVTPRGELEETQKTQLDAFNALKRQHASALSQQKHYVTLSNSTDALLGTLIGKIQPQINNNQTNVVLADPVCKAFWEHRQAYIEAREKRKG